MAALNLTPQDTNYLTSLISFQHISQNKVFVKLAAADVSAANLPRVLLAGNGDCQVSGSITIDANPIADMPLCTIEKLNLDSEVVIPVSVLRTGVYLANFIKISVSGEVTLLNAPTALDVILIHTPKFLLTEYN